MLTSEPQLNSSEESVVYLTDLEPADIHGLREWFCYTKPVGPSIRVVASSPGIHCGFRAVTTGTELGPGEDASPAKRGPTEAVSEMMP